jgi:hypothetical protein
MESAKSENVSIYLKLLFFLEKLKAGGKRGHNPGLWLGAAGR